MSPLVTVEKKDDGVLSVFFNRPEKRNAMSPELHKEMLEVLSSVRDDENARVVVLSGKGESFCAGMDLEKFFLEQRSNPSKMDESRRTSREWMNLLRTMPKVTIAAVNGWCFGAGIRVLGLCDIAFASDRATFGLSEINFGIIPAGGVMKTIADQLGWRDALYLALTGEPIDAKTAEKIRLVNRVVPHEKLYGEVYAVAAKVKRHNPIAVQTAKEVFQRVRYMDDSAAWDYEIAKTEELNYLQKGEWVDVALKKFKEKQFKPGLKSYNA